MTAIYQIEHSKKMFKGKSAYYELLSAAPSCSSAHNMKDFNRLKVNQREISVKQREMSVTMYNHNKKGGRGEIIKAEEQPGALSPDQLSPTR